MSTKAGKAQVHPAIYVIGAILALIVLIPLWTLFVMTVIEPDSLTIQEQTMGNRILWWVMGPVIAVAALFGAQWVKASKNGQATQKDVAVQVRQAAQSEQQRREYVLEVIGLGITLDKYRQGKLWGSPQGGPPPPSCDDPRTGSEEVRLDRTRQGRYGRRARRRYARKRCAVHTDVLRSSCL